MKDGPTATMEISPNSIPSYILCKYGHISREVCTYPGMNDWMETIVKLRIRLQFVKGYLRSTEKSSQHQGSLCIGFGTEDIGLDCMRDSMSCKI
jgi:hypothetical protein